MTHFETQTFESHLFLADLLQRIHTLVYLVPQLCFSLRWRFVLRFPIFHVCVCRKGTGMRTRSTCLKRWNSWGSSMQEGSWRSAWFLYSAESAVPVVDSESRGNSTSSTLWRRCCFLGCLRLLFFRSFSARHRPHHILAMTVVPTLSSRGQYWLLSLATSLIPITVTPQKSSMTSLMTPPPQVIKATKVFRKKEKKFVQHNIIIFIYR